MTNINQENEKVTFFSGHPVYIYIYIYMDVYVYIYTYIYVYIFIRVKLYLCVAKYAYLVPKGHPIMIGLVVR